MNIPLLGYYQCSPYDLEAGKIHEMTDRIYSMLLYVSISVSTSSDEGGSHRMFQVLYPLHHYKQNIFRVCRNSRILLEVVLFTD